MAPRSGRLEAAGAVGVSVLQQARLIGARVIGTASEENVSLVESFGGVPVSYADGLAERRSTLACRPGSELNRPEAGDGHRRVLAVVIFIEGRRTC